MPRRAVLLALAAALLAGCAGLPSEAAQEAPPCGHLSLTADPPRLVPGALATLRVGFENCGETPLRVADPTCGLRVEGPTVGVLFEAGLLEAPPPCAPVERVVLPGRTYERSLAWDGWVHPECGGQGCAPPQPAPSGHYRVGARLDATGAGERAWTTSLDVDLLPWTQENGGWAERHVAWLAGAGAFSWRGGAVEVPEGWSFATDGATFLYASDARLDHAARDAARCRAEGPPGAGTWVLVKASACAWSPWPGVTCAAQRPLAACGKE